MRTTRVKTIGDPYILLIGNTFEPGATNTLKALKAQYIENSY